MSVTFGPDSFTANYRFTSEINYNSNEYSDTNRDLLTHCTSINRGESMSLLLPSELRSPRPRNESVFYMSKSYFPGGVLDRSNYMVRCYMSSWIKNGSRGPSLRSLLWNGQSSKQKAWVTISVLMLQGLLPFLPLLLFTCSRQDIHHAAIQIFLWILFLLEFFSSLWHFVIFNIILYNYKIWRKSWFTYGVPVGTIGLIETSSADLTLFYQRANIRFVEVLLSTIHRLDTVSLHDQMELAKVMTANGLQEAEIILYTDDFIDCYISWPRNIALGLMISAIFSTCLVIYFLTLCYS